ncbi:hypothetical protein [Rhodanobacter ginsengiterrae]|uniref:hypothetical protein n=1 Tax=Rhodanobacter ginsengiterrae TaxID=2008451 RepID=UPI003CEC7DEB
MARRRGLTWNLLLMAAWLLLLALLPWWLGLPLLLALVAVVVLLQHRLAVAHVALIRWGLRWGLPGLLFALQRSLGGDAFAWGAALLGALAGYTLLAGLEAWLDRERRRAPAAAPSAEWPELALASSEPPARIIELQPVQWQPVGEPLIDPLGGQVLCAAGSCRFAGGERIEQVGSALAFSPSGRWLIAHLRDERQLLLWDRQRERRHLLRGWQLAGWDGEQPWLSRGENAMPLALPAVLGEDGDDD